LNYCTPLFIPTSMVIREMRVLSFKTFGSFLADLGRN
jgi:hypothetical protein